MPQHAFMVLAVETTSGGRDKTMFKWCLHCGAVRITSAPEWNDAATYMVPGNATWQRLAEPPDCTPRQVSVAA